MIFPWQAKAWQILTHAASIDRLPHALLLTGIAGIGKTTFADVFALTLLCTDVTTDGFYCGKCHACRLVQNKVHPNVLWIAPDGASIKVDQIREITDFLQLTALGGKYRIVIVQTANAMNLNAANALLKILEEPSADALIMLLSDNECLPITIKSRCQHFAFSVPPQKESLEWLKNKLPEKTLPDAELLLKLAFGAPLKALQLSKETEELKARQELLNAFCQIAQGQADPIQRAAHLFQEMDPRFILDLMLSWMMDLLRLHLDEDDSNIRNSDYSQQLKLLAAKINSKSITSYMSNLQQLKSHFNNGLNLNKQLLLETLLIQWAENF